MDTCKHDWHFIEGTEQLRCRRCKAETGPRTYDQLTQDMLQDVTVMGSAWSQEGKRIDPVDVYKTTEYDTTQFYMPTGQLQVANFKPNYNLTFHRDGQEVGKFDFNGPEMIFEGDAAESAKVFVDFVARSFHGRLKEERDAGREEARKEMQGRVETLDEMYKLASRQRDELMDQQRAQVEGMRGRIQ
jgi:hypothetical protein